MGQTITGQVCPVCGNVEPASWRELPVNVTLKAHMATYVSPVKQYYFDLTHALAAWGNTCEPEEE